jgi:flagellar biogenesis protein FliO
MKSRTLPTILILFLVLFGLISNSLAQETENQPNAQNSEIMGENDRLPFMQNEQTAASPEPTSGGLLFKTLGAMFLIIGLLFFGAWGVKKYGLFGVKTVVSEDAPNLKIMSSVSVASGQTLSVVRFGERVLLVGSTAQSFTLLADEFSEVENVIETKPKSVSDLLAEENASFGKELNRAQNRLDVWNGGEI